MEAFVRHTGVVVALNRANVDTDAIIPKQFLKSIQRSGFGQYLFDAWRYLDEGEPGMDCAKRPVNPDFELNRPEFANGSILLAGPNFGCGSSREHAPWALQQYGFKTIIAPSYADIFFNNCFKNGLLPIVLKEDAVENMFAAVASQPGITATVDLANQTVTLGELQYAFSVDEFRKHCLMHGLDDIGLTLQHQAQIRTFESQHLSRFPWLGNTI